jgi:hypothetical protein
MGRANKTFMKQKDLIIFIFLLTFPFVKVFSTGQIGDRLIYEGDTLVLFSNPLETHFYKFTSRPKLFGDKEGCITTACWRGYQAEWEIIENQLYLKAIYSCCYSEDGIKADLKSLAEVYYVNEKVKADWVTGYLIAPKGKLLYYVHDAYESLYETEIEFQFNKGQLIGTKTYDNSKSKQSVYSQNDEKLRQFIYSNIKWEDLPTLNDKEIKVFIQFSANENGIIDSVKVLKGYNTIFDNEAIRIVKAIPEWDVYYKHGNYKRITWNLPIVFSESNKNEYFKKRNENE